MSMPDYQRHLLNANRVRLVRELIPNEEFFAVLRSNNTLTEGMHADIMTGATTHSKVGKLLDILPKRGAKAFPTLIEALVESHQDHLVSLLDAQSSSSSPGGGRHISQPVDEQRSAKISPSDISASQGTKNLEKRPQQPSDERDRRPVQEISSSLNFDRASIVDEIIKLIEAKKSSVNFITSDPDVKCVNGSEAGKADSFRNSRCAIFKSGSSSHDFDDINLTEAFKNFGINVPSPFEIKNPEDFIKSLQARATESASPFFLFAFAPGSTDSIIARNGKPVSIAEITDVFRKSTELKGKPKILILQVVETVHGDQTDSVSEMAAANLAADRFTRLSLEDENMAILRVQLQSKEQLKTPWLVWSFIILLMKYSKKFDISTLLSITKEILEKQNHLVQLDSSLKDGLYFSASS